MAAYNSETRRHALHGNSKLRTKENEEDAPQNLSRRRAIKEKNGAQKSLTPSRSPSREHEACGQESV